MLVDETKTYKVKINGEEVELKANMRAFIKMYKYYGNAYSLIHSYVFENDQSKLIPIIRCMADKEITEEDILDNMPMNIKQIETLSNITLDLLNQELTDVSEFEVKTEVKKNLKTEKKK